MEQSQCFLYNHCNHKKCNAPFCIRRYKMETFLEKSLIPKIKWKFKMPFKVDADLTDKTEYLQLADIEKNIKTFIENGRNIYLHSANCGNGKTSWAIRLAISYLNTIWAKANSDDCVVLFISVPKLLLALKENIAAKNQYVSYIKDNVEQADLVIWDDIAAKVGTEFELTHLFNFIDDRLSNGKSNIYTSNLNSFEMGGAVEARLRSRICYENVVDIELKGADKRSLSNIKDGGDR